MYIPKLYREDDWQEILEFISQNNFGVLVTHDGQKPIASHLPFEIFETDEVLTIYGHMSRANPQWRSFGGQEALIIFQGAHTYISPRWYNHVNVPTWNYMVVHAYGCPRLLEGLELESLLSRLVQKHEQSTGYRLESLPQDFVQKEMKGVTGFVINVTRLEAAFKLSQNRDNEDYQTIIRQLDERGDEMSHQIASAMRKGRVHS
jgi:transcriptional regulator